MSLFADIENDSRRKPSTGMMGDIENFIESLPSVQYLPSELAKLGDKNIGKFIKQVWSDLTTSKANSAGMLRAGMALCNVSAFIAKRTGNHKFAVLPEFVQNCLAIKTVCDTVNSKIRYIWGKKELLFYTITPLMPQVFEGVDFNSIRTDSAKYDNLYGLSIIELSAMCKFCNSGKTVKFFASCDKQTHTAMPIETNLESVNGSDNDSACAVVELKPKYTVTEMNAPIYAFKIDDVTIAMRGYVANPRSVNGRVQAEITDSFDVIAVVKPGTVVPRNISEILADFVNSLFVQFLDTGKFIYTLNENNGTMVAVPRPTVLPTHFISEKVSTCIKGMENLFERNLSRCYAFVGNPGTGKTIITKQISNHFMDYCTFNITADMLNTPVILSNLISYVKAIKKCIIIIDDLDGTDLNEKNDQVNAYINLFDQLALAGKNDGVSYIFLTTINDPSRINQTLMKRSGRIDETIEVSYPAPDIIDYLMEYNDIQINGSVTTDFKADEFSEAMQLTYDAHLSAADIHNIFADMTISPSFVDRYTPEMVKTSVEKLIERNETSKKSYMD